MAEFMGTVKGGRGEASRLGHKSTGLVTQACSWQGKVHVELNAGDDGIVNAYVTLRSHGGVGRTLVLYNGPVSGEGYEKYATERAAEIIEHTMNVD